MFIRPVTNRMVRDPITRQPLPEGGAEVPSSPYWRRRLREGDVVIAPKSKAEAKPTIPTSVMAKPAAPKGKE